MCACRWMRTEKSMISGKIELQFTIEHAVDFGIQAVLSCLQGDGMLEVPIEASLIDAIFFISSSGISTPSIEARIMNLLPFRDDTKRIPIWGLGCAGGAGGN